jgi:D-arabinose 1-dehydrogenase-like Zn-dependent alcohol dehydrogenase
MRAAVVDDFGLQPIIRDLPAPPLLDDDVLIRVRSCGLCHTDLKVRDGLVAGCATPLVLGHELAGEVVVVGRSVQHIAVGDRGVPYGYETCGQCSACRVGNDSLCEALSGRIGFGGQGGQSELVRVPARLFLRIGPNVDFASAAVATCSVVTPYRALMRRARLQAGESLAIVGAGGGLGLHAVQLGRLAGARVVGVDADESRFDLIRKSGADSVVRAGREGFAHGVRKDLGGRGADVVLDLVGSTQSVTEAVNAAVDGGRVVVVGYGKEQLVQAATADVVFREINIHGCHWASIADLADVLELIQHGLFKPVIARTYAFEDVVAGLEDLASGKIYGRAVVNL